MHTAGRMNVLVGLMFLEVIQGLSFWEAQLSSDGKFWGHFDIVSVPEGRKTRQSWMGGVSRLHHKMIDCICILCLLEWALVDGYICLQGEMGNVVHLYPDQRREFRIGGLTISLHYKQWLPGQWSDQSFLFSLRQFSWSTKQLRIKWMAVIDGPRSIY